MRRFLLTAGLIVLLPITAASAQSGASEPPPLRAHAAEARSLTLYRDGSAAVMERRSLTPDLAPEAPIARVLIDNLPSTLIDDSASAALLPSDSEGLVAAQAISVQAADLGPESLLRHMIGREIIWLVRNPATGQEEAIRGLLRGTTAGARGPRPIVERNGGLEVLPQGRLRLDPLPADLALARAARVDIDVPASGGTLFLRYLATGLSWNARYDITLAADGQSIDFAGDYLLRNSSDYDYHNASLTLVAGDVPRVAGPRPSPQPRTEGLAMMSARAADSAPLPQNSATGDRQIFTIAAPLTLTANSTQRRALSAPTRLPATRLYRLQGQGDAWPGRVESGEEILRPTVALLFANADDGPLGQPLPQGVVSVRAAKADDAQGLPTLLLAEVALPATPVGEDVTLDLGQAFDITARRRLTEFAWTGDADLRTNRRPYRAAHQITVKNAKDAPVQVQVDERFSGAWKITASDQTVIRPDARTARFTLAIPAGGEVVLSYEVAVDGR